MWAVTPAATDFLSLPHYVSATPTTGTVAAIVRDTYAQFRNQQKTATGSAYTYLLDDALDLQISCNKYASVDYTICGTTVYELLNTVTREQKYIIDAKMGDAMFPKIAWNGLTVALDTDAIAGYWYFLTSDTWSFNIAYGPEWTEWKKVPNSLDLEGQLVMRGQVKCENPIQNGVLTSIAA